MRHLPTRQVHLDFHTSEHIEGIGSQFDKKQFQEALKAGHVNSITIFGKCHHGYFYYPTKVGTVHPGLEPGKDLAGEMMEACHEIGVCAPLYLTFGWSALDVQEHPEWVARKQDGSYLTCNYDVMAQKNDKKPESSWIHLCAAGGYREYLYEMTKEACDRYQDLDGLFFDIVLSYDVCYCDHCVSGMRKAGLDPAVEEDAKMYYQVQRKITLDGICEIIKKKHSEASIFFNSVGSARNLPLWYDACTHLEAENLPSVWGGYEGYDKMPMRSRRYSCFEKDYVGMTGKFHKAWGEFGGYKTPEALKFECADMLAVGSRISIGDQLHPLGKMDMETYRNIGQAYSYVEEIEEYCFDTTETAKLGVLASLDLGKEDSIAKLLLDCQIDFDVVHNEKDVFRFDTLILPDNYRVSECMGIALNHFLEQGGKILMLGGSGLKEDAEEFAFEVPYIYKGKSSYDIDYLELAKDSEEGIVTSPILCYTSGHMVEGDGEVLSFIRNPYFNRTYEKYCSHANTPYKEERAKYPGAIRSGNVIYVAHELAEMYLVHGVVYHRKYFKWLLRKLYHADSVEVEMPSRGRIHLVKREEQNQYVLHLLYAAPIQRGEVSVLEDFPTLKDTRVKLHVPEAIDKIKLMPQNAEISFERNEEGYLFTVPEITGHQMVVISYSNGN